MKIIKLFLSFCFCSIISVLTPFNVFSQSSDQPEKADSAVSKHSLYTGLGYGSNMICLGSTITENQPFDYGALTYGFNNELFVSVSAVNLTGKKPFVAFYSGALNYSHVLNSWFDISAGISGYKFTTTLSDTIISDFIYTDLTMGIDWKLIYSRITLGGLFSDGSNAFFQIRNSRYFETPKFFNDKASLSFDPYINLLFGTLYKSETSEGTSTTSGKWSTGSGSSTTTYSSTFSLMEVDFGLPVSMNFDRFIIEAEPSYVLPSYNDPVYPGPKGFVFLLNAYFRIF